MITKYDSILEEAEIIKEKHPSKDAKCFARAVIKIFKHFKKALSKADDLELAGIENSKLFLVDVKQFRSLKKELTNLKCQN